MFEMMKKLLVWFLMLSALGVMGCGMKYQIFHASAGVGQLKLLEFTAEGEYEFWSPLADAFVDGLLVGPPAPDDDAIAGKVIAHMEANAAAKKKAEPVTPEP